jgi:hypothetical protein
MNAFSNRSSTKAAIAAWLGRDVPDDAPHRADGNLPALRWAAAGVF